MANLGKEKTIEQIKAEIDSLSPEERAERLKKAREMLEEKKQMAKIITVKPKTAKDLPNRIRPLTAQEKKELIEHPEGKLKNDFDVGVKIYEMTVIDGGYATFSKLKEEFAKLGVEEEEVSKNLDKLFDLCLIEGNWEKEPTTNTWMRTFTISDEALPIFKEQYNARVSKKVANSNQQNKEQ